MPQYEEGFTPYEEGFTPYEEGFTPYEEGFTPETPKESFLQKLMKEKGIKPLPMDKLFESPASRWGAETTESTKWLGSKISTVGEKISKVIPQPPVPTQNPLSLAQSTLAGAGELAGGAVKGIGKIIGGLRKVDIATILMSPLEAGVKTILAKNSTIPLEEAAGAVLKLKSMPKSEIMSLADLQSITGTPAKTKAATSFVPPQTWKSTTPLFGEAPAPKPFSLQSNIPSQEHLPLWRREAPPVFNMQAGLPAQEQAALDAFRAKLPPQGPVKAPTLAPEAVLGPKQGIPSFVNVGREFHGTGRPINKLSNFPEQSSINYYGDGFYTTDNLTIAEGYSKKGGNVPTIYKVIPKPNVKLYDMEQKIPDELKFKLKTAVGNYTDEVDKASNLRDLYDRIRIEMSSDGFSANDIQETFDSMRYHLEGEGYEGLKHIGGLKTGKTPHNVKIYWTPADKLNISEKLGPKPPISPIPAPVAPVVAPLPPEQTIIQAMKGFKKIRGQQNILLAQERAKRFAAVENIGKTIPGEAGYQAKLQALKGAMPQVQFESISSQIPKPTREWAFQQIENSPVLTTADKVTAGRGLSKIFGEAGGAIPQDKELEYLGEVFSPEFMEAVPKKVTIGTVGTMVSNLSKSMRATFDVSIPFRQGFFFIGRPKQWIPAFGNMYKYVVSKDALTAATKRIQARPLYKLGRESGLSLPKTEEVFVSDVADRIPGFNVLHKASKQAATGFLNDLRASVFDDMANKFRILETTDSKLFKKMKNIPDEVVYKNIAGLTNAGTGRGNLGVLEDSVDVLNMAIFSPRLVASRLQLLYPGYYMKLDPFTRREALKSLFTTAAIGASVLTMAKLGGATVGDDDTSADYGKIKVGDTRFDIWAGFQQPIVAAARLSRNKMISSTTGKEFELGEGYKSTNRWDIVQRFLESKRSPVAAFAQDLIRGQTAMGEKFDIPAQAIESFVPMLTEDMMDLYKEWGPMGLLMAIPGAHGVGSQTYGDQVPVREITKTGTERIRWQQKPNMGSVIANYVRGTPDSNIPEAEQKILVEQRKKENIENIEAGKIKEQVIETGEPRRFGDKIFYLEKGTMKTKDLSETPQTRSLASMESLRKGVLNELRYLGIPFNPNDTAVKNIDALIDIMDYKKSGKERKKGIMSRFILFRQSGNK